MDETNEITLMGLPIFVILLWGRKRLVDSETREVNPSHRFATQFATDMHV